MLKRLVNGLAKRCGYEILGHRSSYATDRSLTGLLRQEQINLVLDVGANKGQFAEGLRENGYAGRIISFEPLAAAHAQLCGKAAGIANWTIADRCALGAQKGSVEIHISGNTVSSSILDMLPNHSEAAPRSIYVGSETVPVNRLDDLCALSPNDRILLKIDVQGYERQVLEGASRLLPACRGVHVEMTLLPLYKGQILARELWGLLDAQGFEPWALEPGFRHPATFRMLQMDGVFVRREQEGANSQ